MNTIDTSIQCRAPWNKGKLTGQKAPLRLRDIWAIRIRPQLSRKARDLALFDLAIDSKLRACDLVKLRVRDVGSADHISSRTIVLQQKTQRPVQFEITAPTRDVISAWIRQAHLQSDAYLFPSRIHHSDHLSTRQYARIVNAWIAGIGLDVTAYGTHTMRRTKATLIYTDAPRTYVPCNCFWDIQSSKAQCATWASKWKMPWKSRSRRRFEHPAEDG